MAGQPEIRIMTDFFNSKVKKSVVCDVRMIQTKTVKETSDRVKEQKWNVSSTSRGKEIKVIFQNDQDKHELLVHFFKGGVWEWYENDDEVKKNPNYERDHRFSIHFEDGTIMSHQDQFHQSHWKWSDKWGNYRSPDIVTENNPWRKHMFDHRKKLRVDRPIFEMMLHPWFFNGVNNFTRSEILCRTSFSPFTPCIEIFTSEELSEDLFDTTKKVLEEVYDLSRMDTYMGEVRIKEFIKDKLDNSTKLDIDWDKYTQVDGFKMTETQSLALKNLVTYNFSVLAGFSGTGKSTSVQGLIALMEDNSLSYTLLCPTGKASMRLTEAVHRKSSTIHRKCLRDGEINSDVIIIDECSMIDLPTFTMLLSCITNPDCRVVMVGDNAQLMPVGVGCLFNDIINSNVVPTPIVTGKQIGRAHV